MSAKKVVSVLICPALPAASRRYGRLSICATALKHPHLDKLPANAKRLECARLTAAFALICVKYILPIIFRVGQLLSNRMWQDGGDMNDEARMTDERKRRCRGRDLECQFQFLRCGWTLAPDTAAAQWLAKTGRILKM